MKDIPKFNLHVGADADMINKISAKIDTMGTRGLGIQNPGVVGKDENGKKIDDGGVAAAYVIDTISDAIAIVLQKSTLLVTVQNRFEHTINNSREPDP